MEELDEVRRFGADYLGAFLYAFSKWLKKIRKEKALVHLIGICIVRIHEYTTDNIKRTGELVCFVFLRPHLGDIFFQETGRAFCIL